ncbi:MAG: DsbA family protein [Candidatus Moranbacteria bacterium]|nr:DsbA family protein [Candidatus Moranbacteria bacterium]
METENLPVSPETEKRSCVCGASKDAMVIAGAILLGSLIIAGVLFMTLWKPVSESAVPTTKQEEAKKPEKPEVTMDAIKALFNERNLVFGDKESKVLFVEFSDPSCPYCHVAAGKNPNLNKKIGTQFTMVKDGGAYVPPVLEMKKLVDAGKAGFVWLYTNGHGNGEMGTKAMYCAHEKGKFWEVHDLLMSAAGYDVLNTTVKNEKSKANVLANFLKSAVAPTDMRSCLESGRYDDRIAENSAAAGSLGVGGTPNFFVNTANFTGAYSFKDMQPIVDQYLQ